MTPQDRAAMAFKIAEEVKEATDFASEQAEILANAAFITFPNVAQSPFGVGVVVKEEREENA